MTIYITLIVIRWVKKAHIALNIYNLTDLCRLVNDMSVKFFHKIIATLSITKVNFVSAFTYRNNCFTFNAVINLSAFVYIPLKRGYQVLISLLKWYKYASEIKSISNDLIKTYKNMNGTCKFEVPDSLYTKLKKIVDDYGVTPAVALIKRFINLYGNITKAKAQRLLTTVTNSLKNGKVDKSDKEFEQVKNVQKHLHDYLESDKLLVTNVQLKGLQGIAGLGK